MTDFLHVIRSVLDTKLFAIGNTPVTVSTLMTVGVILLATLLISRAARHAVAKLLAKSRGGEKAAGTITGLLHYVVLLSGFGVALQTVGIDLSALFAAGALFAVALGFAMQSITQNFVAGVILLTERTIKPGDVLEVEGMLVRVGDMGVRSITAETRDGEHLIIPNSVLIGSTVKNFTMSHSAVRIRMSVGVVYGSDMAVVRETLESVAKKLNDECGVRDRNPAVFMTQFGDNSVNFDVAVWVPSAWEMRPSLSTLHEAVWWALKDRQITIAFPQLDVHLDPDVARGLVRSSDSAA